jgi:hypothetical protein
MIDEQSLFEGLRLASWGIGVLLFLLTMNRLRRVAIEFVARRYGWWPSADMPVPALRDDTLSIGLIGALAVSLIAPLAFTRPILDNMVTWLKMGPSPAMAAGAVIVLILAELYFLWRLDHTEDLYTLKWAACWAAFSMVLECLF